MEFVAIALMGIGAIIGLVYGIMLLIQAFKVNIWWGLGYIFVPFVALVFIIMHWDVSKKPFLMSLISIPFFIAGVLLGGFAAPT